MSTVEVGGDSDPGAPPPRKPGTEPGPVAGPDLGDPVPGGEAIVAPDPPRRRLRPVRRKPLPKPPRRQLRRLSVTPALREAWQRAALIDPEALAVYQPTADHFEFALAIMGGAPSRDAIVSFSGLSQAVVDAILADPVAMAWTSLEVHRQFRHRAALVDAALFARAVQGDTPAIRLFYERFKLLEHEQRVKVEYSGQVDLRRVDTEELSRIVADRVRMLPSEFRVIENKTVPKDTDAKTVP